MLVVADTSPFIGLLKIECIDVLPRLYGKVFIPREVATELADERRAEVIRAFITSSPAWLSVRASAQLETIAGIDLGECASISLARELKADLLLIDEIKGREAAIARAIPTVRTAAVLFEAANAGVLLDLKSAYEKLKATDFRVPHAALDALLNRHLQIKSQHG